MTRILLNVPKVKTNHGYCLPGSVSTVLGYYGLHIPPEEVATDLIPIYGDKNFYVGDMQKQLKSWGITMSAREFCSIKDIMIALQNNKPPIAHISSYNNTAASHVVVVRGIDTEKKEVYLHDSVDLRWKKLDFATFKRRWNFRNKGDAWKNYMCVIQPF